MGSRHLYAFILILFLSAAPAYAQRFIIEPQDILVDGQQGLSLADVWKIETQMVKEGRPEHKYDSLDLTIEKGVELQYDQSGRKPHLALGYALPVLVRVPSTFKSACDPSFPDPEPYFNVPLHVHREGDFRQFSIRWQSDAEHTRAMKELEPFLKTRMKLKRAEGSFKLMSVELVNTRSGETIFRFR